MGNRIVLAALAERLKLRIALPRADAPCPNDGGSLCWGWTFDDAELDRGARAIQKAAHACFVDKPYGVVGFSNGGYLLSEMVRSCTLRSRLPGVSWAVTSGSQMFRGTLEPEPASLAECGDLVLVAGEQDPYDFDPTDNLRIGLEKKGAHVREIRYAGDHALAEEPLLRALGPLVGAR